MTDEQIKQNAAYYASENYHPYGSETNPQYLIVSEDSFIAGAHSRDEEITRLSAEIEDDNHVISKLREEVDQLRNPWISVEDRLPECKTKVLVRYIDGDAEVVWYKNNKFVCVVADQQRCIGKTKELVEGLLVEEPIYSTPKREVVTDIVTHWMPIHKLKQ